MRSLGRVLSTPTHNTYQKSGRKKERKKEIKAKYIEAKRKKAKDHTFQLKAFPHSDLPILLCSIQIGRYTTIDVQKKPSATMACSLVPKILQTLRKREKQRLRGRESSRFQNSLALSLYLCLLFLFFFIWFSHFSQTNCFGFTKVKIEGLTKIALQMNSEKCQMHSGKTLQRHWHFYI